MDMHQEMYFKCPAPGVLRDVSTRIFRKCTLTADMGQFKAGDVIDQITVDWEDQTYLFYHRSFTYLFKLEAVLQG